MCTKEQGFKFLRDTAKMWKATISFDVCLSVCPSVRPHVKLGSHWIDLYWILYLKIFWKFVERDKFWLKTGKNCGYFT
jgi:hypothetical protein